MMNLSVDPSNSGSVPYFWSWAVAMWDQYFFWSPGSSGTLGLKDQIDKAKSIGCNMVRHFVECGTGVYVGSNPWATIADRIRETVSYCHSQGMWYYGGLDCNFIPNTTDFSTARDAIVDYVSRYCGIISGFPNVFACDICNEFDGILYAGGFTNASNGNILAITNAQLLTVLQAAISACRQTAPNLSLSASFHPNNGWNGSQVGMYSPYFDHLDFHAYFNPSSGDSQAIYAQSGTSGKAIFIGETGCATSDGSGCGLNRLQLVYNNVYNVSYPGQPGCKGLGWWTCTPENHVLNGSTDYGMFDWNGNLRSGVGPTFQGYQSQVPLISSVFPKIGWS